MTITRRDRSHRAERTVIMDARRHVPRVGKGEIVSWFTDRSVTLAAVVVDLCRQAVGPCKVGIITFAATEDAARSVMECAHIERCWWLVDAGQKARHPETLAQLGEHVRYMRLHAKAVSIIGQRHCYDVTTSANLTRAGGVERYTVIEGRQGAEALLDYIRGGEE